MGPASTPETDDLSFMSAADAATTFRLGHWPLGLAGLQQLVQQQGLARPLLRQWIELDLASRISLAPEQEQARVRAYLQERGVTDEAALQTWLAAEHLTLTDLTVRATLPERLQQAIRQLFAARARSRFLAVKAELEQVSFRLLRVGSAELAEELFLRHQHGEATMEDLAREFGEGPEREQAGYFSPQPLQQLHPQLAQVLRSLQPEQLSRPVPIGSTQHLIQLLQLHPVTWDEGMEQRMIDQLYEQWIQERVEQMFRGDVPDPLDLTAPQG